MNPLVLTSYINAFKGSIELLKMTANLIPDKEKADLKRRIAELENNIELSNAAAAKDFHYPLCQCTFPPQIMLRNNDDYQCGNCQRKTNNHAITIPKTSRWDEDD